MQLRLKVVKGKPRGHCLAFPNGDFIFGRGPECDVRPNSALVSRQHCLLHVTDEQVTVRDLGSMNGTLVNGQAVSDVRLLNNGDTLQIGPLMLEVLLECHPSTVRADLADTAELALDGTKKAGDRQEPAAEAILHAEI